MAYRARYQQRSCHSPECSVCGEKATLDIAWKQAQRIEATETYIRQYMDAQPHTFEIVFSPPQGTKKELATTLFYAQYEEGLQEFEGLITEAIRIATGDREGYTWGYDLFYHPFRQNGTDGQKNGWNGNDGIPDHWRYAPHFHMIITTTLYPGQLVKAFNDLRKNGGILFRWVVKVGPNQTEEAQARAQGIPFKPHEITGHTELENKLDYIISHVGIVHNLDAEGNPVSRRRDIVKKYGLNHHTRIAEIRIRQGVPLLNQGYQETFEEDGISKPVYWAKLIYECFEKNLDIELARVERINSACVFVPAVYRDELKDRVEGFIRDNPDDLEGLYRLIRIDRRFITNFIPREGCELRYPNRLYTVDGGDLRWILSGSISEEELYKPTEEYLLYCEDADRRDEELRALGVRI